MLGEGDGDGGGGEKIGFGLLLNAVFLFDHGDSLGDALSSWGRWEEASSFLVVVIDDTQSICLWWACHKGCQIYFFDIGDYIADHFFDRCFEGLNIWMIEYFNGLLNCFISDESAMWVDDAVILTVWCQK